MITTKVEETVKARMGVAGALAFQAEGYFDSGDLDIAMSYLHRAAYLLSEAADMIDSYNCDKETESY